MLPRYTSMTAVTILRKEQWVSSPECTVNKHIGKARFAAASMDLESCGHVVLLGLIILRADHLRGRSSSSRLGCK